MALPVDQIDLGRMARLIEGNDGANTPFGTHYELGDAQPTDLVEIEVGRFTLRAEPHGAARHCRAVAVMHRRIGVTALDAGRKAPGAGRIG